MNTARLLAPGGGAGLSLKRKEEVMDMEQEKKIIEIKHHTTGSILFSVETESLKSAIEAAVSSHTDLKNADLWNADLKKADLWNASLKNADLRNTNLQDADLRCADLRDVDLRNAYLWCANLRNADLRNADLRDTNLRDANLKNANLRDADLKNADLRNADLRSANLRNARIKFPKFPSIGTLSSIYLYELPDELTLELMRRDATAHPYPERFSEWAEGGRCPYQAEEYFWDFEQKRHIWKEGKPKMKDVDLIFAICKAKGWQIRGYLEEGQGEE